MGCCGSCGGEAPNHINDQHENKNKEKETDKVIGVSGQPQESKEGSDTLTKEVGDK
jgi:hypothetical protein